MIGPGSPSLDRYAMSEAMKTVRLALLCIVSSVLAGCAEPCEMTDDARCNKNKVEQCRLTSGRTATWQETFDCESISKVCSVGDESHAEPMDYCITPAEESDAAIEDAGSDAATNN